jgi:hypothetical protein
MDKPEQRSGKTYVLPSLQGWMVGRLMTYWGVYHVMLWHTMFLYRYMQYRGELLAGGAPRPFSELFADFLAANHSVVVCAVAVFPIVAWDMLRVSHRVAGPLIRFRRTWEQMAQGQIPEAVRLRKGDMLQDMQVAFNAYLARLADERFAAEAARAARVGGPHADGADGEAEHESVLEDLAGIESLVAPLRTAREESETSPEPASAAAR